MPRANKEGLIATAHRCCRFAASSVSISPSVNAIGSRSTGLLAGGSDSSEEQPLPESESIGAVADCGAFARFFRSFFSFFFAFFSSFLRFFCAFAFAAKLWIKPAQLASIHTRHE